jgi:hypothetical protein
MWSQTNDSTSRSLILGLDHIPLAVVDLDAASERYRQLGFVFKPGRPHRNGIRNQHIKFPDGTALELITAPDAGDPLTAEYRRHLRSGDGPAFVGLYSPHLDRVAQVLDSEGKIYHRDDRTLSFPDTDSVRYIFFGGRCNSPTDLPRHFRHPNGAESLIGVWIASDNFEVERRLLSAFGLTFADKDVSVPDSMKTTVAILKEGEVVFIPGSRQLVSGRRIVGASLRTRDLELVWRVLSRSFSNELESIQTNGSSLFVPPTIASGMWLEFREEQ